MMGKKQRPKTGFSRSMQINLYKQSLPQIYKKKRLNRFQTSRCPKIDSDDPETIYNWIQTFQDGLILKGKGYQYPQSKYLLSKQLSTSEGYRNTIYSHKKFKKQKNQNIIKGGLLAGWKRYQVSLEP